MSLSTRIAAVKAFIAAGFYGDPIRISISALVGAALGGHMIDQQIRKESGMSLFKRFWCFCFRVSTAAGGIIGVVVGSLVFLLLSTATILVLPLILLLSIAAVLFL